MKTKSFLQVVQVELRSPRTNRMRREKTTGDTESDAQLQDPLLNVLQQLRENKPAQQETKQRKVQQKLPSLAQ